MLSWAVLDENMPPAFYTLLWWPSGATFQCAWPDFFSSIQLTGFLCVGLIYLIFFLFFLEGPMEFLPLAEEFLPRPAQKKQACWVTSVRSGGDVAVQAGNTRQWVPVSSSVLPVS